ncbi:MAG: hypothetical protein ORN83_06590, partial [Chthoniobacteraceae bacterium]|nr:hypothetical protein [Chthoniobacteraceae bacterium]
TCSSALSKRSASRSSSASLGGVYVRLNMCSPKALRARRQKRIVLQSAIPALAPGKIHGVLAGHETRRR